MSNWSDILDNYSSYLGNNTAITNIPNELFSIFLESNDKLDKTVKKNYLVCGLWETLTYRLDTFSVTTEDVLSEYYQGRSKYWLIAKQIFKDLVILCKLSNIPIPSQILAYIHLSHACSYNNHLLIASSFRTKAIYFAYSDILKNLDYQVEVGHIEKIKIHTKRRMFYAYKPIYRDKIGPYSFTQLYDFFRYITSKMCIILDFPYIMYHGQEIYCPLINYNRNYHLPDSHPFMVNKDDYLKEQSKIKRINKRDKYDWYVKEI
jgi:hypothetical protein